MTLRPLEPPRSACLSYPFNSRCMPTCHVRSPGSRNSVGYSHACHDCHLAACQCCDMAAWRIQRLAVHVKSTGVEQQLVWPLQSSGLADRVAAHVRPFAVNFAALQSSGSSQSPSQTSNSSNLKASSSDQQDVRCNRHLTMTFRLLTGVALSGQNTLATRHDK